MTEVRSDERTLLVASTGGHLEQLYRLSRGFIPESHGVHWVTHDDQQSRSLLAEESVEWVPYVPPRGYREMLSLLPVARRILREGNYRRVVSTGAGMSLSFFLQARRMGIDCYYIESAARTEGPSMTGRLLRHVPGMHLYCQYEHWADDRWTYQGSLFDTFEVEEVPPRPIRRVVVTLGTMRTYPFTRLTERINELLPDVVEPGADILWQVGATPAWGLTGRVHESVPHRELQAAITEADLVIAHAGIGSALAALERGKRPVLVPRRAELGEHVDDHQTLIAAELGWRNLSVSAEADRLTAADLRRAAEGRVVSADRNFAFALEPS